MVYELWRDDALNRSAAFATEQEALAAIREELVRNGPAVVLRSALVDPERPARLDRDGGDVHPLAAAPPLEEPGQPAGVAEPGKRGHPLPVAPRLVGGRG